MSSLKEYKKHYNIPLNKRVNFYTEKLVVSEIIDAGLENHFLDHNLDIARQFAKKFINPLFKDTNLINEIENNSNLLPAEETAEETELSIFERTQLKNPIEFKFNPKSKNEIIKKDFRSDPIIQMGINAIENAITSLEKPKINKFVYVLLAPITILKRIWSAYDFIYFLIALFLYTLFIQVDLKTSFAKALINPDRLKRSKNLKYIYLIKINLLLIGSIFLFIALIKFFKWA